MTADSTPRRVSSAAAPWRAIAAAVVLVILLLAVGLAACSATAPKADVKVPSVIGLDYAEAAHLLTGAGFHVLVDQEVAPKEKPLTVLKQTPAGGATAKKGASVTIIVAGPAQKP